MGQIDFWVQRCLGTKKCLCPKRLISVQIDTVQKKFGSKNYCVQKNLCQKPLGSKKYCMSKNTQFLKFFLPFSFLLLTCENKVNSWGNLVKIVQCVSAWHLSVAFDQSYLIQIFLLQPQRYTLTDNKKQSV